MAKYTYDYFIYTKDDTSNERLNTARKSFNYTGQDMYVITRDGEITLVQSEKTRPHTQCTLEECAQQHIQEMIQADEEAEKQKSTMEEMQADIKELQGTKAGYADVEAVYDNLVSAYSEGVNNA